MNSDEDEGKVLKFFPSILEIKSRTENPKWVQWLFSLIALGDGPKFFSIRVNGCGSAL